jgi:putative transcriptional regulator
MQGKRRRESRLKNKLVQYRKEYGYSQDKLAGKLGVSRQTVISIEKGKYYPSLPLAFEIAKTFDTRIENIFIYEERGEK